MFLGSTIGAISYAIGALAFAILTPLCLVLQRQNIYPLTLLIACLITAVRCTSSILYSHYNLSGSILLIIDIAFYGIWITTLLHTVKLATQHPLPKLLTYPIIATYLAIVFSCLISYIIFDINLKTYTSTPTIWTNIVFSILSLILIEQLYKNLKNADRHSFKFFCLGLAALFTYELYLYTHTLIFQSLPLDSWQARGGVYALVGLFLLLTLSNRSTPQLTLSRKMVFYTTSLTGAGILLFLMGGIGYYMRIYGGSWGGALQKVLIFASLAGTALLFSISKFRATMLVLINKHFFRHKYDYRNEWLNLIQILSQPVEQDNLQKRTIKAVAHIFGSPGGVVWQLQHQHFLPICATNCSLPEDAIESVDSAFVQALRDKEWVFEAIGLHSVRYSENNLLPSWSRSIKDLWIILPLLNENSLLGFMALQKPAEEVSPLSWEDLDLLKTVGRQIAAYLARHEAAELLAQSRQFDTYNKLTAFIMHDLKNLIAQQALVVQNAVKHKNNAEFFDDAINTIDNSVTRMSSLLSKLQTQSRSLNQVIPAPKLITEAAQKCRHDWPVPELNLAAGQDLTINADIDTLTMVLCHLIKNAQEATPADGAITIGLHKKGTMVVISIEDTGSGMDDRFIRDRLFKPFDTTKSGKGMGIGVFQAREYIRSLQGEIHVKSQLGKGSLFTLSIPENSAYCIQ
ncbi:putative PEP-CTERM system histidine kinase [Sinobacterium caligoides]|uniref:histidine kinase n=1 Tax=Sinobacterium caligoides TaxID=933926 RepID=A0A3N2D502_9GAMM|nr:XrtA/PEP-CTERM system histidine kinase PrsK [Sinobacterium caligoides]ROR94851.1 putative PEP-CTERM system histidine kinase [Sinobacterium caligoides]